jgi:hypothetical protein
VVAPALEARLYDLAPDTHESALQLWAVIRTLERVPAAADDHRRFLEVKRRIEARLVAAGLNPADIERSFADAGRGAGLGSRPRDRFD